MKTKKLFFYALVLSLTSCGVDEKIKINFIQEDNYVEGIDNSVDINVLDKELLTAIPQNESQIEDLINEDDIDPYEESEEDYDHKINDPDGYSNLRDAPKGNVIKRVLDSERFEVIGEENGYKKIRLKDGTAGYMHSSRVIKSE